MRSFGRERYGTVWKNRSFDGTGPFRKTVSLGRYGTVLKNSFLEMIRDHFERSVLREGTEPFWKTVPSGRSGTFPKDGFFETVRYGTFWKTVPSGQYGTVSRSLYLETEQDHSEKPFSQNDRLPKL